MGATVSLKPLVVLVVTIGAGALFGMLAGEVDAVLAEVDLRLGRDLERLRGQALGRELEDAVAARVEPQLGDHLARVVARLPFELQHEDRPEHREIVQLDPLRGVRLIEGALLLGVELAQRALAEQHLAGRVGVGVALQPPRAHESAGDRIDLNAEPAEPPDVLADLLGVERPQLDHRIADAPLDPARAHDNTHLVERKVGRVEEHHLRIWASSASSPSARTAARCSAAGTVSLGSTETEPRRRPISSGSCASVRLGRSGVLVAMVLRVRRWCRRARLSARALTAF